mmetsp:Transcript_40465/g.52097  ORF Transcript_40465/g.52097 Transcript_40465/m.52097 type:complete len:165 (+) Transcript_40465:103-597(+)
MLKRGMEEDADLKNSSHHEDKKRPCITLDMNAVNSPLNDISSTTNAPQCNSPIGRDNLTVKIPCQIPPDGFEDNSYEMAITRDLISLVCGDFFKNRRPSSNDTPPSEEDVNMSTADQRQDLQECSLKNINQHTENSKMSVTRPPSEVQISSLSENVQKDLEEDF